MWVAMISLFPELVRPAVSHGVLGRALDNGIVTLELINPRAFARDRHNTVDDRPYGGGPGMVMMQEPLEASVAQARHAFAESCGDGRDAGEPPVIYL